jgi:hypothetical protein
MVDAPASPSAASRSLARRRNECTRQGRLWLPGPARRAGPRVAAQAVTLARTPDALLPGWRAQAVGRRIGRIVRTERRSRGPFSGLRAPPPPDCRNAVDTAILRCLGAPVPLGPTTGCGRARQACQRRRNAGHAQGANRQPGRPRSPPQPAGATMRSSRRLRGRGAWRPSGPACHAHRPAHRPRPQGCSGVPARGEVRRAPVVRSSGARIARQHAAPAWP